MKNESNSTEAVKLPDLTIATSKILAIGSFNAKGMDMQARIPVMIKEVPATLRLYLTGAIELWWVKPDISGAVFVMNVKTIAEAHELLEKLPLGVAGMMDFQFVELAPISPLRFLLTDEAED
ncbi:hypothetical protein [Mucilaginibacter phyllosphaerae]